MFVCVNVNVNVNVTRYRFLPTIKVNKVAIEVYKNLEIKVYADVLTLIVHGNPPVGYRNAPIQ